MSKESGKILGTAKSFRERADYADFVEVTKEDAQNELENTKKFVAEAEAKLKQLIRED
jgi:uncharacterized protein (UPF0332 family)